MKHARSDYDRIQDPSGRIPIDEPVFLLRGQDASAAETLRFWADENIRNDGDRELSRLAEVQADAMDAWRVHKPADLPVRAPSGAAPPAPSTFPACCTPTDGASLAERLFCVYNAGGPADRAGLAWDGRPVPAWAELPADSPVRAKWEAVAVFVEESEREAVQPYVG